MICRRCTPTTPAPTGPPRAAARIAGDDLIKVLHQPQHGPRIAGLLTWLAAPTTVARSTVLALRYGESELGGLLKPVNLV